MTKAVAASFAVLVGLASCAASKASPLATPHAPPAATTGAVPTSTAGPAAPPAPVGAAAAPLEPLPAPSAAAPEPAASSAAPASTSACNEQAPQEFLIRGHFLKDKTGNERAIQYRTDTYGYFKGYGHPSADAQPPSAQTVTTKFMGLPVRMHRKVAPVLPCVEAEIKATCAGHPYTPQALAGIRFRNTYRGGEVTNHAYGIAIDVDPARNTCCGCVPPWNDAPACKRPGKSEYDHMDMPECWVHAFERYGFYWLGHDVLKDTMHFEFLGDPDKILRTPSSSGPAPSTSAAGIVIGAPAPAASAAPASPPAAKP
ncbi:MAG TPA: M15 family metallopeptidase [Polyangiaceae bacterium]|jgi:hypothetical protein|nr:M15 family metallopeptidase [Polyangiaceae bacterium]